MALNSQQERIIGFLAQGLKPSQIATIVGCTPAYISQLLGEEGPEGFAQALTEKAKELSQQEDVEEKTISAKYLSMEHKLLQSIENRFGEAEFPQLVNALKVVGERQEKRALRKAGLVQLPHGNITQNIVNISVPSHALPELRMNERLEVTAVDERIMAPMSSAAVRQLFQNRRQPLAQETYIGHQQQEQLVASTEF